jgi:hypothetical protein
MPLDNKIKKGTKPKNEKTKSGNYRIHERPKMGSNAATEKEPDEKYVNSASTLGQAISWIKSSGKKDKLYKVYLCKPGEQIGQLVERWHFVSNMGEWSKAFKGPVNKNDYETSI